MSAATPALLLYVWVPNTGTNSFFIYSFNCSRYEYLRHINSHFSQHGVVFSYYILTLILVWNKMASSLKSGLLWSTGRLSSG